jgi:hypothetical protein
MDLVEAIKSRQPFFRKGFDAEYWWPLAEEDQAGSGVEFVNRLQDFCAKKSFSIDDVLADDWCLIDTCSGVVLKNSKFYARL